METSTRLNPITGEIEPNEYLEHDRRTSAAHSQAVVFYDEAVLNEFETRKQGTPQFDKKLFVIIDTPGSKDTFKGYATELHINRYPNEYRQYLDKASTRQLQGLILEHWPEASRPQVATLKANNVFTVEQFANVDEGAAARMGANLRDLLPKAVEYVNAKLGKGEADKLKKELEESKAAIAEMQEQMKKVLETKQEEKPAKDEKAKK